VVRAATIHIRETVGRKGRTERMRIKRNTRETRELELGVQKLYSGVQQRLGNWNWEFRSCIVEYNRD
jgi:hypothetical protein